jgi:glycosyltransferase involved in cell wall biosynthesis
MDLSIVIPCFNEERNISALYAQLKPVLTRSRKLYELIFIDDGSRDNTSKEVLKLRKKHKQIHLIRFRKNFGKSLALAAGFKHAKGKIIITMDADLQDDPQDIPRFVKKIELGYDLVAGWRYRRKDKFLKKLVSKLIYNKLAQFMTRVKIHDFNCGFKAYKREVIQNIKLYGEMHRYIPALASQKGYRIGELKVHHHRRKFGKTKFGKARLLRGTMDLITVKFLSSYSGRPLHFFGALATIFLSIGTLIGVYLTLATIFFGTVILRPSLILAVLLMVLGIQFFSIGLFSEMLLSYNVSEFDLDIIAEIK